MRPKGRSRATSSTIDVAAKIRARTAWPTRARPSLRATSAAATSPFDTPVTRPHATV